LSTIWTEKYRPGEVRDVVGNSAAVEQFVKYMESWEKGRPSKKSVLLYGPPGVGKTTTAIAYAREHGYDLVEVNASDFRNAERIKDVVGSGSQQSTLTGTWRRMILVDEVDGIAGQEDAGGVAALSKAISETKVPIVLVANDPWSKRLATLRQKSKTIPFRKVHQASLTSYLRRISKAEGVNISQDALQSITRDSDGDLRSAINDLQTVSEGRGSVGEEDLGALGYRDRLESVFDALNSVFLGQGLDEARRSASNVDKDLKTFFTWILDNAPKQLAKPSDLASAMEALAGADVHMSRIYPKQRWVNLRYAVPLMTGGVALSRTEAPRRFVKFTYPEKFAFMARARGYRARKMEVASKIASKCHCSSYVASRDILPFLCVVFQNDKKMAGDLTEFFDFGKGDVEFLSK